MNPFLTLDFAWKLLFFTTILSSFYFVLGLLSPRFSLSSLKKVQALRGSQSLLLAAFVFTAGIVFLSDRDLVADCFGQFASREGVFGYTRWISTLWIVGFLIFFLKDFWTYRKITSELRRSVLQKCIFQFPNQELLVFHEVSDKWDPLVAGLFRSEIFVPQRIVKDPEALKQVLSHESIHLYNRDIVWNFLSTLIYRMNWFNPLAWMAMKKERLLIEMATDESAIQKYKLDISEYAQALLNLVRPLQATAPFTVYGSGDFQFMQSRLLYLKDLKNGKIRQNSFYIWFAALAMFLGLGQAVASIRQTTPTAPQVQMCFQVQHELFIEGLLMEKRVSEPNKCE